MTDSSPSDPPIVADRILRLIDDLAAIGATPGGGVDRPALGDDAVRARRLLVERARTAGLQVERDPMANLFVRCEGLEPDLAAVATGSHIDSQPTGGRLDGAYGVCGGLEALTAIAESGMPHRRAIEIVAWTNEEGSRFAPGAMGSAAFVDPTRFDEFAAVRDADAMTVGEELARIDDALADVELRPLGGRYGAFVELHIEQGPVLEAEGQTIGVVTGIQGCRWFRIESIGAAAHAGTTPLAARRDALNELLKVLDDVRRWEADADLRVTIGSLEVEPGTTNTIAGRAVATVDLRHPDAEVLDGLEARLAGVVAKPSPCTMSVERTFLLEPTTFPARVVGSIEAAAERIGVTHRRLLSGAFHDAAHLAEMCPTGMIFVPSVAGVSHNPAERTAAADLVAGVRVLASTLLDLAEADPLT